MYFLNDLVTNIAIHVYLQGLKFISFPYLLTLQLKRFAFDYATLHRVKLNDRLVLVVKNKFYQSAIYGLFRGMPVAGHGKVCPGFLFLSSTQNDKFD